MKNLVTSLCVVTVFVGVGAVVACNDDGSSVTETLLDSGVADTGTPTTTPTSTATTAPTSDASVDSGVDAGGCPTVNGVYALNNGSCTSTSFSPAKLLCVRQTGCNVVATTDFLGQSFSGTISETAVSATSAPGQGFTETCTAPVDNGAVGAFTCGASGISCTGTPAKVTLGPAVTQACCNTTTQDCAAGERCTLVGTSNAALPLVNACLPDNGTADLHASCTRASTNATDIGNDTCKKGLFCANLGQPSQNARVCQKICTDSTDCTTAGEACFSVGAASAGVCVPRCEVFPANGGASTCAAGTTCREASSISGNAYHYDASCDYVGAGAAGATCTYTEDCADGLTCPSATKKCSPYCDTNHPCATGTCVTFTSLGGTGATGFDASLGVCQ